MKILQIEYSRALAALLVVAFHFELTSSLPKYFGQSTFDFFRAGNSGVQIFFVLSGFVMYFVHRNEAEHNRSVLVDFVVKRFNRIYVPLWIVLSALVILYSSGVTGADLKLGDVLLAFAVLPAEREGMLAVEWTLRHEVLFYALFALFLFDRWIGTVVLIGWGAVGSLFGLFVDVGWLERFLFSPNHLLFLFGIVLGRLYVGGRIATRFAVPSLVVGTAIFVATWGAALRMATEEGVGAIDVGYGVGVSLCLYGALAFRSVPNLRLPTLIGSASYSLYLLHFPLVSLLCKVFTRIGDFEIREVRMLYFVLAMAICVLVAIAFHLLVERPVLRVVSRISRATARR